MHTIVHKPRNFIGKTKWRLVYRFEPKSFDHSFLATPFSLAKIKRRV